MVFGRFRDAYERVMRPVGHALGCLGLTPNIITVLSVAVSVIACWAFYIQDLLLGGILAIFAGIVDMFDGAVARATNTASPAGAVFDHVLDRYAELFIVLGVVLSHFVDWWVGLFCIFSMIMASFTRAKAESVGGLPSCTVGIAERQEKLGLILLGVFVTYLFPTFSLFEFSFLALCLLGVGVLSQITVLQRLRFTFNNQRVTPE